MLNSNLKSKFRFNLRKLRRRRFKNFASADQKIFYFIQIIELFYVIPEKISAIELSDNL